MTERTTQDMSTDRREVTGEKQKERPTESSERREREPKGGAGTTPRETDREPRPEQSPDDAVDEEDSVRGPAGGTNEPTRTGENQDEEGEG